MVVWGIIPISGRSEIGLPPGARGILFQAMSTLAEIEAAIENLPVDEQRTLLQFVAERVHRSDAVTDDPVQAIIGAYRVVIPRRVKMPRTSSMDLKSREVSAFLDTGAIFALIDTDDQRHAAVWAIFDDRERTFVLHELILVETLALITKRLYTQAALAAVGAFRASARVEKGLAFPGPARNGLATLPTDREQ